MALIGKVKLGCDACDGKITIQQPRLNQLQLIRGNIIFKRYPGFFPEIKTDMIFGFMKIAGDVFDTQVALIINVLVNEVDDVLNSFLSPLGFQRKDRLAPDMPGN